MIHAVYLNVRLVMKIRFDFEKIPSYLKTLRIFRTEISFVKFVGEMPIGGKLRLKGDKKSGDRGKKRSIDEDSKNSEPLEVANIDTSSILTETQKKHMAKKLKMESERSSDLVKTTYRERVENYNVKLSTLTEHNDLPRVSAAGNG